MPDHDRSCVCASCCAARGAKPYGGTKKSDKKTGFWKTLGNALNEKAVDDNERKAREAELKAGKTFRRTGKQLRKAEKFQARSDRMKRS